MFRLIAILISILLLLPVCSVVFKTESKPAQLRSQEKSTIDSLLSDSDLEPETEPVCSFALKWDSSEFELSDYKEQNLRDRSRSMLCNIVSGDSGGLADLINWQEGIWFSELEHKSKSVAIQYFTNSDSVTYQWIFDGARLRSRYSDRALKSWRENIQGADTIEIDFISKGPYEAQVLFSSKANYQTNRVRTEFIYRAKHWWLYRILESKDL